jgi:hypothetical protein
MAIPPPKRRTPCIWETLMDAATILLTANTETVYALGHLDLKTDGATVVEARRRCSVLRSMPCSVISWTSVRLVPTKGKAANISSFRRDTEARCRTVTSSSDHRPSSLASEYEASKDLEHVPGGELLHDRRAVGNNWRGKIGRHVTRNPSVTVTIEREGTDTDPSFASRNHVAHVVVDGPIARA